MLGKDTFYYNIIRKYVVALGSLFNDIHVIRKDKDDGILKDIRVPITFASKDKARYQINSLHSRRNEVANIGQILPRISYTLTSMEFDTQRLLNAKLQRRISNNIANLETNELPIGKPFNFNFQFSIWTKYLDDMFQIIEQLLTFFNPDYYLTIKEIPELNIETNIPVIFRGLSPSFETEFDETSWRTIRFEIEFELKGWLYPAIEQSSIIEKIKLNYYNKFDQDAKVSLFQSEYDEAESEVLEGLIDISDSGFDNVISSNSIKGYEQRVLKVYKQTTEPILADDELSAYWFDTGEKHRYLIEKINGIQKKTLLE